MLHFGDHEYKYVGKCTRMLLYKLAEIIEHTRWKYCYLNVEEEKRTILYISQTGDFPPQRYLLTDTVHYMHLPAQPHKPSETLLTAYF